ERMLAEPARLKSDPRGEAGLDADRPYASEERTYRPEGVDSAPYGSGKRTHEAVRKTDRKSNSEVAPMNVSEALVQSASTSEAARRTESLSQFLVEELGDHHSKVFYRKVAQSVPEAVIHAALSETKAAQRGGEVRRSAGALFTHLIKVKAMRLGIRLTKGVA